MNLAKNIINTGVIQGIIVSDVMFPNDHTAVCWVKIKERNPDAEATDRGTFSVQLIAFDAAAQQMRYAERGMIGCFVYSLSNSKKTDNNGITVFYKNRIVKTAFIGEKLPEQQRVVPYINEGICEGELASFKVSEDNENEAVLSVRVKSHGDNGREYTHYIQFTVKDEFVLEIQRRYNVGDYICFKFKLESVVEGEQNSIGYSVTYVYGL